MINSVTGASEVPIQLDLSTGHHIEAKALPGGGYEITTTGNDPYVTSVPLATDYDPEKQYVLSFDYFSEKGVDGIELFYGPPIIAGQSASGPELLSSEGWTSYALNIRTCQEPGSWRGGYSLFRLDFGRRAGRTLQIRNITLQAPTAEEEQLALKGDARRQETADFDARLQAMVDANYDARISRVQASADTIRVALVLPKDRGDLFLCEVPLYQSPVGDAPPVWQQTLVGENRKGRPRSRRERATCSPPRSKFGVRLIELPRMRDSHDRVFSSWILMRKTADGLVPASHQRFVDEMPSRWTLTRDRPASRKGLPGIDAGNELQVRDYEALEIRNATKNIVLPALVRERPGNGLVPHEFNGTTVYIDTKRLESLDASMQAMEKLKMVVSAIILVPRGHAMSHPDCTPQGIYAMANVVERDGWNTYAAGLDFLAQRYTRADRKYGRMTHWILHNEVDAGWVWTNAGEKPLHTYLDLYYRSMRTAQSVIRRYGNAGQVLMSLTHYWTSRHNSRCYPPKALLDLLARRCAQEGDFDWGLAYHPYPQNLRDPRTWLDKKISFNFDTPLITPKNLEVLDSYMRQERMLYDGKLRTIVLSEQGSNSPDHSAKSYRDQAAGLVYTWLKLEQLDLIESYVHHRWLDHPREGGLNLGLRRRPETSTETARAATAEVCRELAKFGLKSSPDETSKPAWEIYRVLETPQQHKAVEWADTIIPLQYLENLQ